MLRKLAGEEQVARLRDTFVARLADGAMASDVIQLLTGTGPLAGFSVNTLLPSNVLLLSTDKLEAQDGVEDSVISLPLLASALAEEFIDFVSPVFIDPLTGGIRIPTGEIIVRHEDGVDPRSRLPKGPSWVPVAGARGQLSLTDAADRGEDVLSLAAQCAAVEGIEWAYPVFVLQAMSQTVDPLYASQWTLTNTGQTGGLTGADAGLADAWTETSGSSDVIIAVIEAGVELTHPDLAPNAFVNDGESGALANNGIDDDGNGYVDDWRGWDFGMSENEQDDNNPSPDSADPDYAYQNHATAVAGVAVAAGENGQGIRGAAYSASLMSVNAAMAFPNEGLAFSSASMAEAIRYAAGIATRGAAWRGADIINLSWGLVVSDDPIIDAALEDAATLGRDGKGVPIFASAGNSGSGYRKYPYDFSNGQNDRALFGPGSYQFKWEYSKDSAGATGQDAVWLANVTLPDGTVERFADGVLPANWSTGGDAGWQVTSDPAYVHGRSLYAFRSGAIAANETSWIISPTVTVGDEGEFAYAAWVSSELNGDYLRAYVSKDGGTWEFLDHTESSGGLAAPPSTVHFPASSAYTIAVGASSDWDLRSEFSEYGADLDILAPSMLTQTAATAGAVVSTDRVGANGYNPTVDGQYEDPLQDMAYTGHFGGTSSASPLAAGIGALVLAKNPELSADDVRSILRTSADKIGPVQYINGRNNYYGYGRVNAAAAVGMISDAPTGVDLLADYDSGASNSDNLTNLDNSSAGTKLKFAVSGTVNGATVMLYAGDEELGSAIAVGSTTEVWTNGTVDLLDGQHAIVARQTESGAGMVESAASSALEMTIDTAAPNVAVSPTSAGYGPQLRVLPTSSIRKTQLRS